MAKSDEALLEGRIAPNKGYPALGYLAENYEDRQIELLYSGSLSYRIGVNIVDVSVIVHVAGAQLKNGAILIILRQIP